jgi:hypothetical protein
MRCQAGSCQAIAPPAGCTVAPCGTEACLAFCPQAASETAARISCTAPWCIVTISDISENECIRVGIQGIVSWIGYVQSPNQTAADAGWSWTCGTGSLVNWATGEPNDGLDGVENGEEQCAWMAGDGTWADDKCGNPFPFVCSLQ